MRHSSLLLTTAAICLLSVNAAAQDSQPPADPPASSAPAATGLSGLQETVSQLRDEPAPAEEPAVTPASQETAAPAPAEPVSTPPSPEPATPPTPEPRPPVRMLTGPAQPLSRAETAQLDANVARGRLLGTIAGAGQIATQDMLSHVPDPNNAGISGWIAVPEGNGSTVTFYADGAPPAAVYRATVLGGRVVSREVFITGNRPPLGPIEARMAAARRATDGLDHQPCGGQDFNVFVVPPSTPNGPIDVYQFSAQTQRGHFPLGGHFKTTVAADGSVLNSSSVTGACRDIAVTEPAAGQAATAIAVTDATDSLPTEVHVFMTMWTAHPLVVTAGDPSRRFAVGSDRIAEIPR